MADKPLGLGLQYSLEEHDGRTVLVGLFQPGPQHQGAKGFLHGGMAATALDEAMAGVSYARDRTRTVTATLNLRYRRLVPLSTGPLRVEAWAEREGAKKIHRIRGRIVLPDGTVAVEAKGIFVQTSLEPEESHDGRS
jgi:acyl-coenzyme A thioesterase PaaI-like protein